jgi:hypothetical protein
MLILKDNTSVMSKVTATLGRNFIKSKEFQEAQLMGLDMVFLSINFIIITFLNILNIFESMRQKTSQSHVPFVIN